MVRRWMFYLAVFMVVTGLFLPRPAAAQSVMDPSRWFELEDDGGVSLNFYFFWSNSCPHCQAAHPTIDALPDEYPWLNLLSYEVSTSAENALLYDQIATEVGQQAMYVPAFIFCGGMTGGWAADGSTGVAIEDGINACHTWAVENRDVLAAQIAALGKASASAATSSAATLGGTDATGTEDGPTVESAARLAAESESAVGVAAASASGAMTDEDVVPSAEGDMALAMPVEAAAGAAPAIALPFIGELNAASLSLPALTVTIAALDAFNPCAFFVLMFLLSLMVHAQNRKRMLIIGVTFVFFSGLIYFVFMSAWLNIFLLVGELKLITLLAGLIAIGIALLNIKDYFWFKQGVSLSIPDRAKPGLYQRSRNLLKASSLPAMLFGTAVLAIAANSYELLCTSGFPMVYTRALTLNDLPTGAFYAYLAAYNLIYVIPLLLIVVLFTVRFGSHKLSEQEGRVLKLLSGLMMLALGVLLVVAPDALNQVATALGLLVAAVIATALIVWIDRRLHRGDRQHSQPA